MLTLASLLQSPIYLRIPYTTYHATQQNILTAALLLGSLMVGITSPFSKRKLDTFLALYCSKCSCWCRQSTTEHLACLATSFRYCLPFLYRTIMATALNKALAWLGFRGYWFMQINTSTDVSWGAESKSGVLEVCPRWLKWSGQEEKRSRKESSSGRNSWTQDELQYSGMNNKKCFFEVMGPIKEYGSL